MITSVAGADGNEWRCKILFGGLVNGEWEGVITQDMRDGLNHFFPSRPLPNGQCLVLGTSGGDPSGCAVHGLAIIFIPGYGVVIIEKMRHGLVGCKTNHTADGVISRRWDDGREIDRRIRFMTPGGLVDSCEQATQYPIRDGWEFMAWIESDNQLTKVFRQHDQNCLGFLRDLIIGALDGPTAAEALGSLDCCLVARGVTGDGPGCSMF